MDMDSTITLLWSWKGVNRSSHMHLLLMLFEQWCKGLTLVLAAISRHAAAVQEAVTEHHLVCTSFLIRSLCMFLNGEFLRHNIC